MYTKSTFCKLPNHFKVAFKALLFFTFSLLLGQPGFATADIEVYYEYDNIILTTIPGEEPLIGIATYSVIVKNNGPDEATNLEIQMNYHDEVVVTDRNFSVGTWEGYYWAVPSLGAGETVTYTETSNIWVPYNNKWVMAFLVGADQPDPDSELNGASFDEDDADRLEIISPVCDLDLTLAVQGDLEFDEYEHVLYEVVVQNLGPHAASNVTVHFPLPAGMVYSASSATQGEYELYYETWNIGNLVSGQTVLLNLDLFTLDADAPKKAFAQVQTSDQPDPDSTPGNDTNQVADEDDEAEVTISPPGFILPDLAVFGLAPIPTGNYSGRSQTNEIYFDLRNIGAGSVTEEFQIGAYLSTDEFFSPDDVLLGDYNFPFGIDGGEIISELSFDAYVPYDQAPGDYFLLFYTDAQNTISEEDEINNIYVYPFEIRACAGIIDLESQAAVDAFGPCEVFDGTIYMSGDDITDFSSFDLLREVTGGLYLNVDNVETIAGFQNLEKSNYLRITDCEDLVTLDAFTALQEAELFSIRGNPNLENISSFLNPMSLGGLTIEDNDKVINLLAFYKLQDLNNLTIAENASLYSLLGLENISTTLSSITIADNDALEFITDLFELEEVTNNFIISNNPLLHYLNLFNLVKVGGKLTIDQNASLENLDGLISLEEVGWNLEITNNAILTECCGIFPILDLGGVVGDIIIENNPSFCSSATEIINACSNADPCVGNIYLANQAEVDAFGPCTVYHGSITISGSDIVDLTPLNGLTEITGDLIIKNNLNLETINSFHNMVSLGGNLEIVSNEKLATVEAFTYLDKYGGAMIIRSNFMMQSFTATEAIIWIDDFTFSNNELMEALPEIGGNFRVLKNLRVTNNLALKNLSTIDELYFKMENVYIQYNPKMESIYKLHDIEEVFGDLFITQQGLITSVPFWLLGRVEGNFALYENPLLDDITSIDNLEFVGSNMNIQFNPKLSFCCNLFPILTSGGVQGETFISDNADFCNSPEQIIEECADFDYCTSLSDFPWHEWISLVQVNEIDHASEKSKYSDFTNLSTDLERGSTNAIHLQTGFSYYTAEEHWRVWIDFNQNGEFTDYAELVVDDFITPPPHGTANASLFSNISVPTNAKFGPTRMRVSMQRGSAPAPCGIIPFGEVEDYTVNIVPGSGVTLTIECPDDIFISLPEGTSGTTVNWGLPSIDYNCPGGLQSLTQTGGQPSGTYLTAGVYFIEYTAMDHCENEATCSFVITIEESSGYCDSESAFPWHEWISNVTLHNFSNPSGKSNYSDFTEHIIELEQQLSYSLILETSYSYTTYDEYWQVWIDYNQNGVFEEPSEFAFFGILERPADGTDSKLLSGNIFIPGDALPGPTRMRVSMKRGDHASPCETIPFGEVEDYTINISEYNNSPNSGNANRWTYSTIQSEDLSLGELRLFPNPAKTAINVLLDASAAGTGVIRIYDARGQMMLQKEIADVAAQAIPILLDKFENGLYFLSVLLENKKMRTSKFVVESKR